ncbi:hypothetical protein ACFSO9_05975 [Mesonia maritima]|uniref:hypothetical protein n=1 Tax=Mesonia maritima TaxID=1793873 RepID=UPI00362AA200
MKYFSLLAIVFLSFSLNAQSLTENLIEAEAKAAHAKMNFTANLQTANYDLNTTD